jgi:hypothetical protein
MPIITDSEGSAEQDFGKLLHILENNNDIVVIENAEEWEDDEKLPTITPGEVFRIPGSVASFVERLDDELTRSLQQIDPHTAEYVDRLTDETALYTTLVRVLVYAESLKRNPQLELNQDVLNRVIMRRLEHLYFKVRLPSAESRPILTNHSLLLSSPYLRRRAGTPSLLLLTPKSLPAPSPTTPLLWSRRSARTSSSTAKAFSVRGPCCVRSTSWRCTTTTIRHAI